MFKWFWFRGKKPAWSGEIIEEGPPVNERKFDREAREQREWEETSTDPIAVRHRYVAALTLDNFLLAMAAAEEEDKVGFCSIARSEIEKKNELRTAGLVRDHAREFAVTQLTDKGRERVKEIRRERGTPMSTVYCGDSQCGHGFNDHRSENLRESEVDDGKPWDHYGECKIDGCGCRRMWRRA